MLNGVGRVASGLGDLGVQFTNKIYGIDNGDEVLKAYRQEFAPGLRDEYTNKLGGDLDKGLKSRYQNETFTGALGGLAQSVPAIALTAGSGGLGTGAMFLQSYDSALESINQSEAGQNLDETTKTVFAGGVGLVTAALEKYGFDKIFKGETGVISNLITRKALEQAERQTAGKVTGDIFTKFLDKEVLNLSNKFVKGGAKALDGALVEYGTEAAQEGAQAGAEILVNKTTGKPVFDISETSKWDGFLARMNKAGIAGAIGGGLLGGVAGLANLSKGDVVKQEQSITDIDNALANESLSDASREVLVQRKIDLQNRLEETASKIDEAYEKLDPKQKDEVNGIVEEKVKLQEAIADPALSEEVKASLQEQSDALDKQLSEIKPVEGAKESKPIETTTQEKEIVTEPKTASNEETNQVTEQQVPNTEETGTTDGKESVKAIDEINKRRDAELEKEIVSLKPLSTEEVANKAKYDADLEKYNNREQIAKDINAKYDKEIADIKPVEMPVAKPKFTIKGETVTPKVEENVNTLNEPIVGGETKDNAEAVQSTSNDKGGNGTQAETVAEEKQNGFEQKLKESLEGDETRESLSNISKYSTIEEMEGDKDYNGVELKKAFDRGVEVIDEAKKIFGDDYVEGVLNHLDKIKVNSATESLTLISLENDLEYRLTQEPDNVKSIENKLRKVRKVTSEIQRDKARAVGFGIMRSIAKEGFDVARVKESFFSDRQKESIKNIKKSVESDGEALNKQQEEQLGDVVVEKPTGEKLKKAQAELKDAKDSFKAFLKKNRAQLNSAIDPITFIKEASKLMKAYAKLGIVKVEDVLAEMKGDYGDKFVKDNEKMLRDAHDAANTTKEKTPEELLEQAKENLKKRIQDKKDQIADKKVELEARGVKFDKDAEYKDLERQLKQLNEQSKEFLTDKSKDLLDERKKKAIVTKLENELADLDEQIDNQTKKEREAKKDPLTNDAINDLKALKKAKQDLLNEIDPDAGEVVKQALIDAGYGREITVNTNNGKEKRTVLDWKLLTSAQDISEAVDKALDGYTQAQKDRLKIPIQEELGRLREDLIDKSNRELNRLNTPIQNAGQKTSAKRLAELYDMGLFEQNPDTYDYLINNAMGMSLKEQQIFFRAKAVAKSLSNVYKEIDPSTGKRYSEFAVQEAVSQINREISSLMRMAEREKAGGMFNAAVVAQAFIGTNMRNKLTSIRNLIENVSSGYIERKITQATDLFLGDKLNSKELRSQKKTDATNLLLDTVINGGGEYGGTGSPFVSRNLIDDAVNDWIEKGNKSKAFTGLLRGMEALGSMKLGLEGADSYNKILLTENQFAKNIIDVLSAEGNPNRMTKDEARSFYLEQITGEKRAESLEKAKSLIRSINDKAGRVVLKDNVQNINRLANNMVKDNIINASTLNADVVKSSFDAAYTAAGSGLGHEANNFVSAGLNAVNSNVQRSLTKAIKEENWPRATALVVSQIVTKNIMSPFVGGGANWTVLSLQKMGVPANYLVDLVDSRTYSKRKPIDITTPEGIKQLKETLATNAVKNKNNARILFGVAKTALVIGTMAALGKDKEDDLRKYFAKHPFAKKAFNKLGDPAMQAYMARGNKKEVLEVLRNLLNQRSPVFDQSEKNIKAITGNVSKGSDLQGVIGDAIGDKLGLPYAPVPFFKDLVDIHDDVIDKTLTKEEKQKKAKDKKNEYTTKGFWNGFFRTGVVNAVGGRPEATTNKK